MTARIGADDTALFEGPRPVMLQEITGIAPESGDVYVRLDEHAGVRSTQRLALSDVGGGVVVGLWPGELKSQAEYLYDAGRAGALIAATRERGWEIWSSPHLAFYNSSPAQRLYLDAGLAPEEYAQRWEGEDGSRIGEHSGEQVRVTLWPWLKERGYAGDADDRVLEDFLAILKRRRAHLRAGLRLRRRWEPDEVRALGGRRVLAVAIRDDVDAILGAAGEPPLPAA